MEFTLTDAGKRELKVGGKVTAPYADDPAEIGIITAIHEPDIDDRDAPERVYLICPRITVRFPGDPEESEFESELASPVRYPGDYDEEYVTDELEVAA